MRLELTDTDIPAVKIIRYRVFQDSRGTFAETYSKKDFAAAGLNQEFVQDNQSFSVSRGTIRGLHFQMEPAAQAKLVRVSRGAILDVAVDLRRGSPTYGKYISAILSAENATQLFIPQGFAHGFCTMEDNTVVDYKVTDFYSPAHERGIRWDDPALSIEWGAAAEQIVLSDRDQKHPFLKDQPDYFTFDGSYRS
jgi:dTDP-4-dehydrorhamnose 3,5-epimerase